jgi:hypothetical protein
MRADYFLDWRGGGCDKKVSVWAFELAGVGGKIEFADRPPIKGCKFASGQKLILVACG